MSAQPLKKSAAGCYVAFDYTARADYALDDPIDAKALFALTNTPYISTPLDKLLFLDAETTGLSGGAGTLAFLTGMGYFSGDKFVVEQVLMRDYDEETFALERIAQRLNEADILLTFNGATFDMPLLSSRFTMNRMRDSYRLPPHIDLLKMARSAYRMRLKRCSLASLEEQLFGLKRENDMPGALVPKQYFDFLKVKDMTLLEPILRHNVQDIRTLPQLFAKLLDLYQNPLASGEKEDVYSIGRVLEKRGGFAMAHRCYRAADVGALSRLTRQTLANSLRRQRDFQEAARIYERMILSGQGGAHPYIALAKLMEHKFHNLERALSLTNRAMLYIPPTDDKAAQDAQKRALRLMKKLRRS